MFTAFFIFNSFCFYAVLIVFCYVFYNGTYLISLSDIKTVTHKENG